MWKIRWSNLKIIIVSMVTVLLLTGCGTELPGTPLGSFADKSIRVGLITNQDGTGSSYYSQVWEGLQKAEQELGVGIAYLKAKDDKEYTSNLKQFKSQEAGLILTFGNASVPTVIEAAKANPKIKYVILDARTEEAIPDNVLVISYKEEEAAFLAGNIAGQMTKSYVVGFITGRNDESSERYHFGFKAGLRSANPDCEFMKGIAATYTDRDRVQKMAESMLESRADVIFHIAGIAGNGMFKAVENADKYAIGSIIDQHSLAPGNIISSVVINNDIVVYDLVEQFQEENLSFGKNVKYGLAENAVGLSKSTAEMISEAIYNSTLNYKEQISSGKIVIPDNENDYHKFVTN